MNRVGIIYSITCSANGRIYIGSTVRGAKQRRAEHFHYLRKGTHHCKYLQRCFSKYGEESLSFHAVETVDDHNFLLAREQFHMWRNAGALLNGVPVSDGILAANASNRGRVMSKEERARRSAILKLAFAGIDAKARATEEVRSKMRAAWVARKARQGAPENIQLWAELYEKGMSLRDIGAKTGSRKGTVSKWLKTIGVTIAPRKRRPDQIARSVNARLSFIEREIGDWIDMRKAGVSVRQISIRTGRSEKVISRELKSRGVV